jgi:hypothetical protein
MAEREREKLLAMVSATLDGALKQRAAMCVYRSTRGLNNELRHRWKSIIKNSLIKFKQVEERAREIIAIVSFLSLVLNLIMLLCYRSFSTGPVPIFGMPLHSHHKHTRMELIAFPVFYRLLQRA